MTQRVWTDEQLSAFLDGELPAADMERLAADIEADASLAARMERLGAANSAYLSAVNKIDAAPVSESLKALMDAPPASNVIAFRPRRIAAIVMEHRAIAASLLCAAAVWGLMSTASTGPAGDPFAPGPDGIIVASSPVHRAFEMARTGEVVAIRADAQATPRLTFVSAEGAVCRQVDVVANGAASAAIACREETGWRTRVVAYGLAVATGDYQTASAARSPALEAFLDQSIEDAPLNAEEEAALLQKAWKPD